MKKQVNQGRESAFSSFFLSSQNTDRHLNLTVKSNTQFLLFIYTRNSNKISGRLDTIYKVAFAVFSMVGRGRV